MKQEKFAGQRPGAYVLKRDVKLQLAHLQSEFVDDSLSAKSDVVENWSGGGSDVEVELPVEPRDVASRHCETTSIRRVTPRRPLPLIT